MEPIKHAHRKIKHAHRKIKHAHRKIYHEPKSYAKVCYDFHWDFDILLNKYATELGADLSKDTLPYGDEASELEKKVFEFITQSVFEFITQSVKDRIIG